MVCGRQPTMLNAFQDSRLVDPPSRAEHLGEEMHNLRRGNLHAEVLAEIDQTTPPAF
jgi:hypothetical protein